MFMRLENIIPLVASIVAILTAIFGIVYQWRELKQKDKELRHRMEVDWKEFQEKYTTSENRMHDWLEVLNSPVLSESEENNAELGYPYYAGTPIRMPEHFYGRRELVDEVKECSLGSQMASLSLLGARKAGKTSFLHYLESVFSPDLHPQVVPVYLDAQIACTSREGFYAYILRTAANALENHNTGRARMPEVPKEIPFMMLRNFFEHAVERSWRFLLLLDEMEHLVKGDNARIYDENFFSALRSIIQIKQISWITASYRIVYMPNTTTSPFTNIMQSMPYIGPLSPADAHLLVSEPAARAGHPFEEEDVKFVIDYAGRMPFLLQKTALQLYKFRLNGKRGKPAHKEVASICAMELERYFDSQLTQLSGEEKLALRKLAHSPELEPELSTSVNILECYGFIERAKGGYKILGNAFRDYLVSKSKIKIGA